MSFFIFDTLEYFNKLKDAGVPPVIADAHASELTKVLKQLKKDMHLFMMKTAAVFVGMVALIETYFHHLI